MGFLAREPVAIAGLIAIAINLAISFGLELSIEQIALINALAVGVLALIARNFSTSTAAPQLPAGTEVKVQGTTDSIVIPTAK